MSDRDGTGPGGSDSPEEDAAKKSNRRRKQKGGPVDKSPPKETGSTSIASALSIRNTLSVVEKGTGIDPNSQDFYALNPQGYLKVPVRGEMNESAPILANRTIFYGYTWGPAGGTATTILSPFTAVTDTHTTAGPLTYDPTSQWQGANWWKSHGGCTAYALDNYIRSLNTFTAAERVKLVKAMMAFDEMARGIMLFLTYYYNRIDGPINKLLARIGWDNSGSNPMFASRDDLLGQVIHALEQDVFLWPYFNFWAHRPGHFAVPMQLPYYKWTLFLPYELRTMHRAMARLFDAYDDVTGPFKHPQTYLREEGLWSRFLTDLVPLLWNKQKWQSYSGINLLEYLGAIGWRPRRTEHVYRDWIFNKFYVQPLTGGATGYTKNRTPYSQVETAYHYMTDWYWEASGSTWDKGRVFYLHPDSYSGVVYTPFLDPIMFMGQVITNYAANNGDASEIGSQILRGSVDFTGEDFDALTYDQFFSFFRRYAWKYTWLSVENESPDVDANVGTNCETWPDMLQYLEMFRFPVRMPRYQWYTNRRWLHRLYAAFYNIALDDIELYRIQRQRESGSQPVYQQTGNQKRD